MNRSRHRIAGVAVCLALMAGASVGGAASALADEAPAPVLRLAPTPVVPQPVVPGHEGDVLLRVSVAMPAATSVKAAPRKAARHAGARSPRAAR